MTAPPAARLAGEPGSTSRHIELHCVRLERSSLIERGRNISQAFMTWAMGLQVTK